MYQTVSVQFAAMKGEIMLFYIIFIMVLVAIAFVLWLVLRALDRKEEIQDKSSQSVSPEDLIGILSGPNDPRHNAAYPALWNYLENHEEDDDHHAIH
ncbi:MAG: hypothetical protein HYW95_00460 [Candidatus Wildermuthbacteria bacterium]|nr:hypothetical protein [Candidatus Wildermuthbacteria bacterium]